MRRCWNTATVLMQCFCLSTAVPQSSRGRNLQTRTDLFVDVLINTGFTWSSAEQPRAKCHWHDVGNSEVENKLYNECTQSLTSKSNALHQSAVMSSNSNSLGNLLHPELLDAKSDGFRKVTARLHRVLEVISKVTPIKNIQKNVVGISTLLVLRWKGYWGKCTEREEKFLLVLISVSRAIN